MQGMYYIGLDVHKRTISYCVKDVSGRIHREGSIPATRIDLDRWMSTLPQPWTAAMEATVFTGWIYDHLVPHAAAVKVAHKLMLRANRACRISHDAADAAGSESARRKAVGRSVGTRRRYSPSECGCMRSW